jgi:hypothetical protein
MTAAAADGAPERGRDHALVVRRRDRVPRELAERDEQPPLIAVRAVDDGDAVEVARGEGRPQRLRQHLAVDVRRVTRRVLIGRMVETGRPRRHAAVWLAHPALAANASPADSALDGDACVRL